MTRGTMIVAANDNARTIEPFHRLFASKLLSGDPGLNAALYYMGQRYAQDYQRAGGAAIHAPGYTRTTGGGYDEWRQVDRPLVDKASSYFNAAAVLDSLGIKEAVESIVFHGSNVVEVGRRYTGRKHAQQARASAITALRIGLLALRNHYTASDAGKQAA